MSVLNVHERRLGASPAVVGALIDSLASKEDRLWPRESWPPMRFDRPLEVGARGGHGPIRYRIETYEPGRIISFRFEGPPGFVGTHGFSVDRSEEGTILQHTLAMEARGWARLSWPLVFRPLHDALLEDALTKAERGTGAGEPVVVPWSRYVRVLRWVFSVLKR